MSQDESPKRSHEKSQVRLPTSIFFLMFVTFVGYTAGSMYMIVKKDNEIEKFRRVELQLQNQIKERDLNLQQFRQKVNQLERRVEIFDAVKELSHASVPQSAQKKIAQVVDETSQNFGLDPYLLLAMMSTESSLRPWVSSHKGAKGLMQLMPSTGRSLAELVKVDPKLIGLKFGEDAPELSLKGIEGNIQLGVLYFTHLMVEYGNMEDAIYAYNLGPTLLNKRKAEGKPLPKRYYNKIMKKYRELVSKQAVKTEPETTFLTHNPS